MNIQKLSLLNNVDSHTGDWAIGILKKGILLICLGILLNEYVIWQHGGIMPTATPPPGFYSLSDHKHLEFPDGTAPFLSDWIWIQSEDWSFVNNDSLVIIANAADIPLGKNVLASPGDILMWVSITITVVISFIPVCITLIHCVSVLRK